MLNKTLTASFRRLSRSTPPHWKVSKQHTTQLSEDHYQARCANVTRLGREKWTRRSRLVGKDWRNRVGRYPRAGLDGVSVGRRNDDRYRLQDIGLVADGAVLDYVDLSLLSSPLLLSFQNAEQATENVNAQKNALQKCAEIKRERARTPRTRALRTPGCRAPNVYRGGECDVRRAGDVDMVFPASHIMYGLLWRDRRVGELEKWRIGEQRSTQNLCRYVCVCNSLRGLRIAARSRLVLTATRTFEYMYDAYEDSYANVRAL